MTLRDPQTPASESVGHVLGGFSGETADVLAYIDWVEAVLWREELRNTVPDYGRWQSDMSWDEQGISARVMAPGETESLDMYDELLPEYTGLLDVQLYWPGTPPVKVDRGDAAMTPRDPSKPISGGSICNADVESLRAAQRRDDEIAVHLEMHAAGKWQ